MLSTEELDRLIRIECLKDVEAAKNLPVEPTVHSPVSPPKFTTPRNAAHHFGTKLGHIYWLIRSGQVGTQWIDGKRLVAMDQFSGIIEKKRTMKKWLTNNSR